MSMTVAIAGNIVVVNEFSNDESDLLDLYGRNIDRDLDNDMLENLNMREFEHDGHQSLISKRASSVAGLATQYTICGRHKIFSQSLSISFANIDPRVRPRHFSPLVLSSIP